MVSIHSLHSELKIFLMSAQPQYVQWRRGKGGGDAGRHAPFNEKVGGVCFAAAPNIQVVGQLILGTFSL